MYENITIGLLAWLKIITMTDIERLNGLIEKAHNYGYNSQWLTMYKSWTTFQTENNLNPYSYEEDKDNFAIAFASWLKSPEGKSYEATGMPAYQLLLRYKDRPYINTNPDNQ